MAATRKKAQAQPAAEPKAPDKDAGFLDARTRYSVAYSRWLHAVAQLADESTDPGLFYESDLAEEKAAWAFLALRPPVRWMVWHKFEVLDRVLEKEDRGGVRDRERELQTLAAIKADLIFFGFDQP